MILSQMYSLVVLTKEPMTVNFFCRSEVGAIHVPYISVIGFSLHGFS